MRKDAINQRECIVSKIDMGITQVNNHCANLEAEMLKLIRKYKNSNISYLESMKKNFLKESDWAKRELTMEENILAANLELDTLNEVFEVDEREELNKHLRNLIFENLCGEQLGDFEVTKSGILKDSIIEKLGFLQYEFKDHFKNIASQIDSPIAALCDHLKSAPEESFHFTKSQKSDKVDQSRKEKKKYVF